MVQEISSEHWRGFFDDFSRKYQGWHASIEVEGMDRLPVHDLPLVGITADQKDGEDLVSVMLGDGPDDHDTHNISSASVVRLDEENRSTAAVTIESSTGERTHVRLTAPGPEHVATLDNDSRDLGEVRGGAGRK